MVTFPFDTMRARIGVPSFIDSAPVVRGGARHNRHRQSGDHQGCSLRPRPPRDSSGNSRGNSARTVSEGPRSATRASNRSRGILPFADEGHILGNAETTAEMENERLQFRDAGLQPENVLGVGEHAGLGLLGAGLPSTGYLENILMRQFPPSCEFRFEFADALVRRLQLREVHVSATGPRNSRHAKSSSTRHATLSATLSASNDFSRLFIEA